MNTDQGPRYQEPRRQSLPTSPCPIGLECGPRDLHTSVYVCIRVCICVCSVMYVCPRVCWVPPDCPRRQWVVEETRKLRSGGVPKFHHNDRVGCSFLDSVLLPSIRTRTPVGERHPGVRCGCETLTSGWNPSFVSISERVRVQTPRVSVKVSPR